MGCIWHSPTTEVTVRDIGGALPDYAYTTLATVLDRLVMKGVLRSRMLNRAKRYMAVGSSGAHTAVVMYEALSEDADPEGALRIFAQNLSEEEAAILHGALGPRGQN